MKSVLIFIKITLFLQTKGHFFTQNNDPWLFSALNNEEGVIILRLKMTPVISLRVSRCQAQMIRSNSMLPFGSSYCYDNIYLSKCEQSYSLILSGFFLLISGGFAFVYVAQDVTTGKDYALKVSILCLTVM